MQNHMPVKPCYIAHLTLGAATYIIYLVGVHSALLRFIWIIISFQCYSFPVLKREAKAKRVVCPVMWVLPLNSVGAWPQTLWFYAPHQSFNGSITQCTGEWAVVYLIQPLLSSIKTSWFLPIPHENLGNEEFGDNIGLLMQRWRGRRGERGRNYVVLLQYSLSSVKMKSWFTSHLCHDVGIQTHKRSCIS